MKTRGRHKFRFQPAQRHTWCECGRWEGMTGTMPDRARHKALWVEHVKEDEKELEDKIRERARVLWAGGDEIEIDDDAKVSTPESTDEGGAFVAAWVWVDFPDNWEVSAE